MAASDVCRPKRMRLIRRGAPTRLPTKGLLWLPSSLGVVNVTVGKFQMITERKRPATIG